MKKDRSKKSSAARSKTKPQKASTKKEPIRDLDLSELESRRVRGGVINYRPIRHRS